MLFECTCIDMCCTCMLVCTCCLCVVCVCVYVCVCVSGRQRLSKNWEENDYYDSDEDSFLDRTGDC